MPALGHSRHFEHAPVTSAVTPKPDISLHCGAHSEVTQTAALTWQRANLSSRH